MNPKFLPLLPAIYRIRDAEQGGALQALLDIIGQQADVLDADIEQLYDDFFIETCADWVVPYLGDLLGVRGLHAVSQATASQRARVANTLRYRRRKGTAAMLEQLARDATGWNVRAVEFFQLLATTQHLNHRRPHNWRTPDLRDAAALELTETPFTVAARTADVRHIASGRGRFNLPNIGLFLWRLQAYPVFRAPAFDHGQGRFSFSPFGHDAPLFNVPATETDITHLAEEINVPGPIRRRAFLARKEDYYGEELSVCVWANGAPLPAEAVFPCNLSGWVHRPDAGQVAVDPELGRLAFPTGQTPGQVEVRYAYGFSADLGGGCYQREPTAAAAGLPVYPVSHSPAIDALSAAVTAWKNDGSPTAMIVIQDSAFYDEAPALDIPAGVTLEIRAGQNADGEQQRPVLRLPGPWQITGDPPGAGGQPGGTLILNGLWLANHRVEVRAGSLAALELQHCTLLPGWCLNPHGTPADAGKASLKVTGSNPHLAISCTRSIAGKLEVAKAETLTVKDSLIAAEDDLAVDGPVVEIEESTVLGRVEARVVQLASNSIFTGTVMAERRQEGCVRFCSLPLDSEVPRRHRCQPTLAIQQALDAAKEQGQTLSDAAQASLATRLQPVFTSRHYGQPGFGQLHRSGPREIFAGADNESEMGAFNHLQQPQREANLRASLDEFLRAGLEAGIFYADDIELKERT